MSVFTPSASPAHRTDLAHRVAQRVESALGHRKFALWFGGAQGFSFNPLDAVLCVAAPHQAAAEWIGRHYLKDLTSALEAEAQADGQSTAIRILIAAQAHAPAFAQTPARDTAPQAAPAQSSSPATAETASRAPTKSGQRTGAVSSLPASEIAGLRHRLETFIVGPSNALAYAAAESLASPANAENGMPAQSLFVYGGCGLGKTHLLQGLCRRYAENNPGSRVVYATGEQFTNAYIEAVRTNAFEAFRKRFRGVDFLAIDDAHFIGSNKKQTQQEFLYTFKAALSGHTRVVLASDSAPRQIQAFSEQLISLCVQGMVVEVRPPDAATRRTMFEEFGRRRGLSFMPAALDALSAAGSGAATPAYFSVREIEGTLTRLHALAVLGRPAAAAREPVGLGLVRQLEQAEAAPRNNRPPRFELILAVCCAKLGASPDQVKGRSKQRLVSLARATSIALAREMTAMSYPEIALALGRDSHSTAITAHQRLQRQAGDPVLVPGLSEDLTVTGLLEELRREIRAKA